MKLLRRIWFVITRWDDAGICILLQFFGLLCFVCIPLMMFVASFAGHAILGAAMGQ